MQSILLASSLGASKNHDDDMNSFLAWRHILIEKNANPGKIRAICTRANEKVTCPVELSLFTQTAFLIVLSQTALYPCYCSATIEKMFLDYLDYVLMN